MAEILYLADRLVEEIKAKIRNVDHIDECYGKVQIATIPRDGKEYVYPALYVGNNQYISLMPDSSLGNFAFIIVKDPYQYVAYAKNKVNKLKASFSLIVWYDSRTTTTDDIRNTEEMKSNLMYALTKSSYRHGSIELLEITEDRKEVYKEFSSREIQENYLLFPYISIRINGTIYFDENCTVNGSVIPPDYDLIEEQVHSGTEAYILAAETYEIANDTKEAFENHVAHHPSGVNADWNATEGPAVILNKPTIPEQATRETLGLDTDDSPEFADILITNLQSTEAAGGGSIPDAQWTWLGAGEKMVLSVLTNIINYIYSIKDIIIYITPRKDQALSGEILLDRDYTQYNSLTLTGALQLSVGANAVVGGFAEGIIVGNGTNTPTLNGITKDPTSADFDATNLKQNAFVVMKKVDAVYITWKQLN